MNNKDILNGMSVYDYIKEILSIPLDDHERRYNGEKKSRKGQPCPTREYGKYRSLCAKEKRLRLKIAEETAFIGKALKTADSQTVSALKLRKHGLAEMCVELAGIMNKKRELMADADKIENRVVKQVVKHRYFENCEKRLPCWNDTAKEMGLPLNGNELRHYVSSVLSGEHKKIPQTENLR